MLGAGSPAGADPASYTAFTWVAAFCQPSFISLPLRCKFSASPAAAAGSIPRSTAADATPAAASWYDGSPPSAGSAASSSASRRAALSRSAFSSNSACSARRSSDSSRARTRSARARSRKLSSCSRASAARWSHSLIACSLARSPASARACAAIALSTTSGSVCVASSADVVRYRGGTGVLGKSSPGMFWSSMQTTPVDPTSVRVQVKKINGLEHHRLADTSTRRGWRQVGWRERAWEVGGRRGGRRSHQGVRGVVWEGRDAGVVCSCRDDSSGSCDGSGAGGGVRSGEGAACRKLQLCSSPASRNHQPRYFCR
mmetsp:Transcript_39427/g.124415  ORF Transcript_39427/g.124415 Transcript_39427/m.124415 type:complete len:314 (+) Transcript_39427:2234-3175(+)